jgi:CubicO group peptidase (beta-lactamase class C family)
MLISSARRAALTGVCLAAAAALTGACGVRPTATVGEPVIVPAATPSASATTPSSATPPDAPASPEPAEPMAGGQIDPNLPLAAATDVEPNTTLGAVVFDRASNQELLAVEPDRQFRSASLVKLLIAIDMLNQGADANDRRKIARMLSMSDDDIASALWVKDGGPALVTRAAGLIGLRNTEPPELSGQWGEVKVTAHDMVRVYQYVMDTLPPEDHTLVVDALAQAPEYAADDFRQYFGIPDGLNAQWAIKQGWGNNDNAMVLHSTGLVGAKWRYVVVLLTEHPLGSGWTTSAKSVTAAAAALDGLLPQA